MTSLAEGPVVIDTGVFAARFSPRGAALEFTYRPYIAGRPVVISFVTRAELRFGASLGGWGVQRLSRVDEQLASVETIWPASDEALVQSYATLRTWAVRNGHGIGQKEHEADRWVAATALWLDVPLVAHDAIFRKVDGLRLLTKLSE